MKLMVRIIVILTLLTLLGACNTLQFSYNNAEAVLRYLAWEYLDVDTEQSDSLQDQFGRLRSWHRSNELPAYLSALRAARERFSRGLAPADIEWAAATVRSHYRLLAERAVRVAAPVLVTLRAEQIGALEKKFAKENARYAEQWIAGEDKSRHRRRMERMVDQLEDWTGRLNESQRKLVERFVIGHPGDFERRLEERRRWQREAVALLKRHKSASELEAPLARLFAEPDIGRPREYLQETRRWESDLAGLIVELHATLDADQRARVLRKLDRYSDDFRALNGIRTAN